MLALEPDDLKVFQHRHVLIDIALQVNKLETLLPSFELHRARLCVDGIFDLESLLKLKPSVLFWLHRGLDSDDLRILLQVLELELVHDFSKLDQVIFRY